MEYKIIHISPVSVTIELENNEAYYSDKEYSISIDGNFIRKEKRNIASVFDLEPDSEYEISIDDAKKSFRTLAVKKVVNVKEMGVGNKDVKTNTKELQEILDNSKDTLVVFDEGQYLTAPLSFRSDSFIYLKKGAELAGSTNREDYPIIKAIGTKDGKEVVNASWEGSAEDSFMSLVSVVDEKNIMFIGDGTINGNADKADWWDDWRTKRGAWRPNNVFTNRADNIDFVGLNIINSPCWNLHPFYSDNIHFIDLYLHSKYTSPNTDGCDPESCRNVDLLGTRICVGDDCVAIKSGKYQMTQKFFRPCENITIRNCYMGDGHGGVVFGSESSCGIKHVNVSQCIFKNTDRGFRVKTKRGRGKDAVVEDVNFDNIRMDNVSTGLVVNMYYYLSSDPYDLFADNKEYTEADDYTPHIGSLTFKNMTIENTKVCAGYFYGLPESQIDEIVLKNIKVTYNKEFNEYKNPAMIYDCEKLHNGGFYFYNVNSFVEENVDISGQEGPAFFTNSKK